ncbi:MAG: ATP synthase F1 subunit delta [Bacteroidota bacterium]|nr:ATP synthase F1 subunit delta [Candidatus Kapabacteria bacterium]MDW8220642.1 ATP synthase F1 subunit delta [Bacteroidota bacterium]
MIQSRVAMRYAMALFQEAQQHNLLETVIEDVRGLTTMLKESRDFALFVSSPIIKASQKQAVLTAIADKACLAKLTHTFLALLVEKNRIAELRDILAAFKTLYNNAHNLLPVEITSAIELDSTQKEHLLRTIEKRTGKKPLPTYSINPSLIGGFTVKIGDTLIDSSLRHQLTLLKQRLLEGTLSN